MRIVPTELTGVMILEPEVYRDNRGFFLETYHIDKYRAAGLIEPFVQDNHSQSVHGVLRGLHLQVARSQAKLIRTIEGAVFDVAVDVRIGSPTFGKWVGVTLSAENFRQCFVPAGFAHGFVVLSQTAQVEYKCTNVYDPQSEIGIAWNDPELGIKWPLSHPTLSTRDQGHPRVADVRELLPILDEETVRASA